MKRVKEANLNLNQITRGSLNLTLGEASRHQPAQTITISRSREVEEVMVAVGETNRNLESTTKEAATITIITITKAMATIII